MPQFCCYVQNVCRRFRVKFMADVSKTAIENSGDCAARLARYVNVTRWTADGLQAAVLPDCQVRSGRSLPTESVLLYAKHSTIISHILDSVLRRMGWGCP